MRTINCKRYGKPFDHSVNDLKCPCLIRAIENNVKKPTRESKQVKIMLKEIEHLRCVNSVIQAELFFFRHRA